MNQQPQAPEEYGDIKMDTLLSDWSAAKTYTENYTRDFQALDNLVDGVPVVQETGAVYVGDTTLAGEVRAIPRDSLQQLPIFAAKINGSKNTRGAIIGSFLLRKGVFNEDTFGKGIISTMQIGAEQALTHGYAPFITATGQMYDEFGTTMRVLHYGDVAPEPGIQDGNESGFWYVTANLTKSRVQKICQAAKNNPDTAWNVEALERLLQIEPETNNYSIYQSDPRKKAGENTPLYQFVTKYEVGKGGRFITFCPQLPDTHLRIIKNRSKFGFPRVQLLVIDPAPLSPFGVSRARLASPNQNLMNAYYQNIISMLLINSDPPIFKRGRFIKPVQLKRKAVWETLDPNATAELKTIDNGALEQFVPMQKQMVSQIRTMMGRPPADRAFGNTSPGAKKQIKIEETSTNQITNIIENFLRQYALVALDTYISEQSGEDTLILDDEAKVAINRIAEEQFVPQPDIMNDPDGTLGLMTAYIPEVGEDNKLIINWDDYYANIETLSVEIELSIGKDEMEEKARQDLQDMLVVMEQNMDPNDMEARQKAKEIRDRLLEKTIPESKRMETPVAPVMPQVQPEQPAGADQISPQA